MFRVYIGHAELIGVGPHEVLDFGFGVLDSALVESPPPPPIWNMYIDINPKHSSLKPTP